VRTVSALGEQPVDVAIVGSGPTGATYARVICDLLPGAKVLVVEAGPQLSAVPGAHVNTIVDPDARGIAQLRSQGPARYPYAISAENQANLAHSSSGHPLSHPGLFLLSAAQAECSDFPAAAMADGVGGMGCHWFGCCPRPSNSERVTFLDQTQLERAYAVAESLLRVSNSQFSGSKVAARLRSFLSGLFDEGRSLDRCVQPMPLAVDPAQSGTGQTGPGVILGPLFGGQAPGFTLRTQTHCQRVVMAHDHVAGIELVDLQTGTRSQVPVGAVVVAADALRTPQLLFSSGIRPAALGRYLNEHPYLSLSFEIDGSSPLAEVDDADVGPGGTSVAHKVMPPSGVTWVPYDSDLFPFHAQLTQRGRLLSMGFFLPNELHPDNRVMFDGAATDWRGLPALRIDYRLSSEDVARIDLAYAIMSGLADALAVKGPQPAPRLMPAGSSLHYEGTVRMGPTDDGTSVCDVHSRVWGTDNLFVAGNGLIPTSTACNPTLTSVAFAVMGAEELVRQLSG
jgi:choline dehydrogenase-like flavoprotein